MRTEIEGRVDLRGLRPDEQQQRILRALDSLDKETGFEFVSERDPKLFLIELQAQRPGKFEWSPLQEGPDAWRVLVSFRDGKERTVSDYLHWDHRRLDALLEASQSFVSAGSCDRAAACFAEFRTGLVRHIRMEEEVLFPVFERSTGFGKEGPAAVMRAEHVEILHLLEEMWGCLAGPDTDPSRFGSLRMALLAVLGDHNEKEEHVVYPLTDRALLPGQRQDLVRRMQAV